MTNQIVFYSTSKKTTLMTTNLNKLVEIDKVVFLTLIILSFLENLVKMIFFTILVFSIWFNLMKFKLFAKV
jgi:hypothetical protein